MVSLSFTSSLPLLTLLLTLSSTPTPVSAHGYVNDLTVAGRKYIGSQPSQGFRAPGSSAVRQVADTNPVKGNLQTNPALTCGLEAKRATEVVDVRPGDEVLFNWGKSWPHRVGPMLTYMASCGQTTCDKFDAGQARWFKISELGQRPGSSEWFQSDLANGLPARATIPPNLSPGNYLIRNEIIALHLAMTPGGAEFYPSCAQLRVLGSGTGFPSPDELVSIPGAYREDERGLLVTDIYEPGFRYVFPGPRVSRLAASSGGGAPANPAPAPVESKPKPANPAPAPSSSKASGAVPSAPAFVGGPINAAPIPSPSASTSPAAPKTPAPSLAPKPKRRCRKRPSAKERAERRKLLAGGASQGVPVSASATGVGASQPSGTPIKLSPVSVSVVARDRDREHGHGVGRRHHSRAMKRLASVHAHSH